MAQRRSLPLLESSEALTFHCNGCGHCCRALRVAVTHFDLGRLSRSLRRPPGALVEWLPPEGVGPSGEPDSFVQLDAGRRLMVLAHAGGACLLLDEGNCCSAYATRPSDCRLFPFDFERDASEAPVALARLPLDGCNDEAGEPQDLRALAEQDDASRRELRAYRATVARWNRLAAHRRRFGRRAGSADEFIEYALASR